MPTQPSRGDVHISRPLTQISLAFMQASSGFVAQRAFAPIPVEKNSDSYFTYARGEFNRDEMAPRAPSTESAGGLYQIGTDNYTVEVFALHKDVSDQVRENQDNPIDLDREAVEYLSQKALIRREVDWVTQFFTAGAPGDTWTFDVDGAASASASFDPTSAANNDKVYWSSANSTPIEDIRQGKRYVGSSTGFRPNIMVCGRDVFDVLLDHPDIVGRLDRGQTTGPAIARLDALAALFELDEILVMDGIVNTAETGLTAVHSYIGGKHALLAYRPPRPGVMTPAAGYTFNWRGFTGANAAGSRIKRFRMEQLESDRVEIQAAWDHKVVSPDLGYFFGDIVQ